MKRPLSVSWILSSLAFWVANASVGNAAAPFSRDAWFADFTQLEEIIADTYPNFDSQVSSLKLSPYALDAETRLRLKNAQSDEQAKQALIDFIGKFQDGHFHLKSEKPLETSPEQETRPVLSSSKGLDACEQMMGKGTKRKALKFNFPLPRKDGFGPLMIEGNAFPWTTLKIENHKIALLKIMSFGQGDYPELCADEWTQYARSLSGACDKKCQDEFVHKRLPNRLLRELKITLGKIQAEHLSGILLDLTDNGGGTNWVGAAMRMLTKRPILCGGFGFIRHPHWVKKIETEIGEIQAELKSTKDESKRRGLNTKLTQATLSLKEARETCQRSGIWKQKSYSPPCSLVVKQTKRDCSPGEEFQFQPGEYGGPLAVLVNRKTASASEDLVGRYKDSNIAKIVGEHTNGSGCGYTDGGIDLQLKNSGIRVAVPDCARFLRDGTNEVAGIFPDINLPMGIVDSEEFVKSLKAAIPMALPNRRKQTKP